MFTEVCLAVMAVALVALVVLFVRASLLFSNHLHRISEETRVLIRKLSDLSSDINEKSRSLDSLFKTLSSFHSDVESDSSGSKTIRPLMRWIASSAVLFKATKEFIRNHEKRT